MKPTNIPSTDSISELAGFWDSHELTNFEDELEDVHESVFERPTEETVTIHLTCAPSWPATNILCPIRCSIRP
jgi:hypothetical protein